MGTSRREFLTTAGRVAVALPAGWVFAQGCGGGYGDDNDAGSNPCSGAGSVSVTSNTIASASTCVGNHLHAVVVQRTDVDTPPAGGVAVDTSTTNDHHHTVTLTEAQLASINSGSTVTVTSSLTEDHSHTFTIKSTSQAGVDNPGPYGY